MSNTPPQFDPFPLNLEDDVLPPDVTRPQTKEEMEEREKLLQLFPPPTPEELEERQRLIRLEAQQLKERLSSTPFYADRAKRWGEEYWIRLAKANLYDD